MRVSLLLYYCIKYLFPALYVERTPNDQYMHIHTPYSCESALLTCAAAVACVATPPSMMLAPMSSVILRPSQSDRMPESGRLCAARLAFADAERPRGAARGTHNNAADHLRRADEPCGLMSGWGGGRLRRAHRAPSSWGRRSCSAIPAGSAGLRESC